MVMDTGCASVQAATASSTASDQGRPKPKPALSFSIAGILGEDFFKEKTTKADFVQQQTSSVVERHNNNNTCRDQDTQKIQTTLVNSLPRFEWLDCTRYKPPKVPRSKRRRGTTIRASRQPRVPFTPYQQATLEKKFQIDHYLTANAVAELSHVLDLPEQRIKIWFQNRRARERREQLTSEENRE